MQEALALIDSICNSQWFVKTSIVSFLLLFSNNHSISHPHQILFLNKIDLFADKLPRSLGETTMTLHATTSSIDLSVWTKVQQPNKFTRITRVLLFNLMVNKCFTWRSFCVFLIFFLSRTPVVSRSPGLLLGFGIGYRLFDLPPYLFLLLYLFFSI